MFSQILGEVTACRCLSCSKGVFSMKSFLVWCLPLVLTILGVAQTPSYHTVPPRIPGFLTFYFTDAFENPGSIYKFDGLNRSVSTIYTRPRGQIYSFTFHPFVPEKLYFVNANDNKIFRITWLQDHWSPEEVVYEHTTYVRDIAFAPDPSPTAPPSSAGPRWTLFFSEAWGAKGGKIYYFDRSNRPVLFFDVPFDWAGDFAFDENGCLYLSSGNVSPAKLYKVEGRNVITLYEHPRPIKGFVVKEGKVYFTDWDGSVLLLDLAISQVFLLFNNPNRFRWISDVGFRP